MKYEMQELRLQFWDSLLHNDPADGADLDEAFLAFTRAGEYEDKKALVLLKACAAVSQTASNAMKRNLKAAILTWFSGGPSDNRTHSWQLGHNGMPHLYEIVGTQLSWRDAAGIVGASPDDYSAKRRVLSLLRDECVSQWKWTFGEDTGGPFEVSDASA